MGLRGNLRPEKQKQLPNSETKISEMAQHAADKGNRASLLSQISFHTHVIDIIRDVMQDMHPLCLLATMGCVFTVKKI